MAPLRASTPARSSPPVRESPRRHRPPGHCGRHGAPSTMEAAAIAVELPGGGARGAYEAGALSGLLPALEALGERIAIACGTSVGAINVALLASVAHLPAGEQAERVLATLRAMREDDVVARIVGPGFIAPALRRAGESVGVRASGPASLMDARRLRASLDRWID